MGFGAGSVGASGAPPSGSILMFGGDDAPDGYVLCDGAAISRTTFANLFAEIGTNYGVGDGSTTFNVPDFRTPEAYPKGAVNNAALGNTGGSRTITVAQLPAHDHPRGPGEANLTNSADPTGGVHDLKANIATVSQVNRVDPVVTGSTGSGNNYDPVFLDVNFIIKT